MDYGEIMNRWAKIIIGDSRKMLEIDDESVDLIVTSPPYWHIKDYGVKGQIGYGQTLHEYLKDLYRVWKECFRVLKPGRRLCINIGDQFARSVIYGKYKIIPLHAELIIQCENIGFDYMGSIIWQKKTTMNTTGGANVMGSYPYPPNGMIEIDYEFIIIFRKPGESSKIPKLVKERSKLTKEEWKEYFYGHWYFGGTRQVEHEAMFPEELPKRLIKMYTFVGDVVLDPFLGSGTTAKVSLELDRNAIGYEINQNFVDVIKNKIEPKKTLFQPDIDIEIIKQEPGVELDEIEYNPKIKNVQVSLDPKRYEATDNELYKVTDIIDKQTIQLDTGLKIRFLGVDVIKEQEALRYLRKYVMKKEVSLRVESHENSDGNENIIEAYVYLKNKIFVNAYLIKSGIGVANKTKNHRYKSMFLELERRANNNE